MTEIMSAPLWMTICVVAGFFMDWIAVALGWLKLKPFTKILAMALVILWTLSAVNFEVNLAVGLLIAAQLFGLAGDFFLLYPNRWFIWGLGAFLVGHLFYIGLLSSSIFGESHLGIMREPTVWDAGSGFLVWLLILYLVYRKFSPYIRSEGGKRTLLIAVLIYAAVLSGVMLLSVFSAILTPGFSASQLILPAGGILFFISDALLAYDRFVRKMDYGQLWVHVTYHLGQFGLAMGAVHLLRG